MTTSFIDRLKAQPNVKVRTTNGATPELLGNVERDYEVRFPDDYRELMLPLGHLSVSGAKSRIHLGLKDTYAHLGDEVFEESLPGRIGDDGGGKIYYYDPDDKLGKGRFAVFLVSLSSLELENTFLVGKSVTEVIERVSAGEDLRKCPRLESNVG
jgi:SMI1/KNR4 family protein SUKH-1